MATNRLIRIRRDKVAVLTLQGFSAVNIAKVLKVAPRTIEKDREKHREEWARRFNKQSFEKALYSFMQHHEASFKEAWKLLEKTNNDSVKLGCINTINKNAESKIKILQSLGIIEQSPEKVELSGGVSLSLRAAVDKIYAEDTAGNGVRVLNSPTTSRPEFPPKKISKKGKD